ncbi:MAG: tetratricopeptide repeat protein [Deltaproteobacteria bacterium]|nr:tetratricopeptide repeat protein [Deltaproteobacteria bacterium]
MRSQSILLPALVAGLALTALPARLALAQGSWELELPPDEPEEEEEEEEDEGPGSAADVPESEPDVAPVDALPDERSYRSVYERAAREAGDAPAERKPTTTTAPAAGVQWGVVPEAPAPEPTPEPPAVKEAPAPAPEPAAEAEPGEAAAEGDPAEAVAEGEAAGEEEQPQGPVELILPEQRPSDVLALWSARRADLAEMDPSQAKAREEAIAKLRETLALENLPTVSAALIREGRIDLENGRGAEALRKAELAVQLSPALPEAEQFLARATLLESPGSVGQILSATFSAVGKRFTSLPERRALQANALALVLVALLFALLAFFAVTVLSRLRLFLHDFHHRFPRGTSYLQTTVVALLLFAVPFFLGLGLLPALLLPAIAVWAYLQWPRRIALLATVAVVGLTVPATSMLFSLGRFWETRAADVWTIENTGEWELALPRLRARVEAGGATFPEIFALARAEKRLGRLERARALYEQALTSGGGSDVAVHNNLGVVLFVLGEHAEAKDALQKAVSLDGGSAAAYHNLAKVFFERSELAKGQEARKRALDLDRSLVEAHPDTEPRVNVALADLPLDGSYFSILFEEGSEQDPSWQVRTRLAGLLPEIGTWVLSLAAMAILFLGGFLRERLGVADPCQRCGRPVCRKCDRQSQGELCGQCINVFEKKDLVAPEVRMAKEKSIRRRQVFLDRMERLLGILVPGLGQVFGERLVLGLILLFLFFFGLTGLLFWNGPVPSALWADGGLPSWRLAGCAVLLGVSWIVSLWSVLRR